MKEVKYTTVEGHEIVRDGEYETKRGAKAVILGFHSGCDQSMIGYIEGWKCVAHWYESGRYHFSLGNDFDLMRPWKALAVDEEDGWIKWEGGKQPVEGAVLVEIKLDDGSTDKDIADIWDWSEGIIAYRIVKEEKKEPTQEKQTLLEYTDKIAGYTGGCLTEEQAERRAVYFTISAYLERLDNNKD